ncbi:MAG: DUF2974 domain-containing protein [Eubacterium sp.]|nr:DUF2974 domain-containing protein [Eubacterium sp.]
MSYITDYIEKYGKFSFKEKPFNDVDAVIFTQLIYNGFDGIVDKEKPAFLYDVSDKFFNKYSDEDIDKILAISRRASVILKACAKTKRFGYCSVYNYVNNIDDAIDKQICACAFILDDDSLMIAFRGTDATVAGLKESCRMSYMFPIPAQIEALHYFQETAMLHNGGVRACGHSKGGNLAMFAAVNCSNSLKKKIVGIYASDAPGFPEWFFDRYDYKQIEDRLHLYTPQSSVVGRLLYSKKEPMIIMSEGVGTKQHNVSNWIIHDDRFVEADGYDKSSDERCEYFRTFVNYVTDDDLEAFYDTMEYIANSVGVDDFYGLKEVGIKKMWGMIDSYGVLDTAQKERFKLVFKKLFMDFAKEYVSEKAKGFLKVFKKSE